MFRRTNQTFKKATMNKFVAICLLAVTLQLVSCDNNSTIAPPTTLSDLIKNEVSDYVELPANSSSVKKEKPSYSTGNELWDKLIRDCLKKPTFSCIQKNVYTYLDTTLNLNDVNVTKHVQLTRNQVDYKLPEVPQDEENEIFFEGRASPIEEVSTALYDKGVKFLVTHNMDVKLPEVMFDGATFRISPRSIEGNGIIAKLEYIPNTKVIESRSSSGDSRLFKIKKKIKKFFKNKILLAVVAIVLIIKIIKIKLFWLLPLLVGVGTAKKLVLKFLLFLFPALSHVLYDDHHHGHGHDDGIHHIKEFIHSKPPKGHISEYLHSAPVPPHLSYQPDDDWTFSGPGLGSEADKKSAIQNHLGPSSPNFNGQHLAFGGHQPSYGPPQHSPGIPYGVPQQRISGSASQLNPQYINSPPIDSNLIKAQRQEALRIQKEQQLIAKQQSMLSKQPFVSDVEPITPKLIDPFYSPILSKLDQVFYQLGYPDEPCRERLVCNMYKTPTRYSPHSNYVSAELSRDSSELQKPAETNVAVVRFYKYVQAARDGQEQTDCASIYPCNLPTKK
ncbi:CLUMA_CG000832, isoform B [Clunio marinus]|uniref:CLUMA_CG000832, isoform B n=1 Tax=Clunio marinus TaxID=568069 RepID=A0A1J1HGF7_9DIPT|nr:CLUMA_CG000832, isoform B [Clunio marinus]